MVRFGVLQDQQELHVVFVFAFLCGKVTREGM